MTEKRYYLEDYKDFTRITLRLYDNKIEHKHYDWLTDCNKIVDLLNEQDERIKELDSENNKLWETIYHTLQFARKEDITIKRNDKGHYKVYSKNVTPKDSPIISITAPSVLFNEYIINQIIEAIDKIPPVQEKEVVTDD